MTAGTGAILFGLLFVEGITILMLDWLFSVHVFVGMLLVPPVALKLATTGYRFTRYYTGSPAYRRAGRPRMLLRAIAPIVVLSTLGVFGTGVALLLLGPHEPWMVGLHKAAFIGWFAVTSVHVLAYLLRLPGLALADWRRDERLGGSLARRAVLGSALAAGLVVATVTCPTPRPGWERAPALNAAARARSPARPGDSGRAIYRAVGRLTRLLRPGPGARSRCRPPPRSRRPAAPPHRRGAGSPPDCWPGRCRRCQTASGRLRQHVARIQRMSSGIPSPSSVERAAAASSSAADRQPCRRRIT